MKEGIIKNAYELIIKELQTLITVFYILAVGIGMLFNYHKYIPYGINIFDYADVFDFLVAPFSDANLLYFALGSIAMILLFVWLDTLWKARSPESYSKANFGMDKKKWFQPFRFIVFSFCFLIYLYLGASFYGDFTSNMIEKQDPVSIKMIDDEIKTGLLIGKVNDFLFLLKEENVEVIPISGTVKGIKIR